MHTKSGQIGIDLIFVEDFPALLSDAETKMADLTGNEINERVVYSNFCTVTGVKGDFFPFPALEQCFPTFFVLCTP